MPYCPQCGTEVGPDDAYCANCGHALDRAVGAGEGATDEWDRADERDATDARPGVVDDAATRDADDATAGDVAAEDVAAGDEGESGGSSRIDVPSDPFELNTFEFSFKYPIADGYRALAVGALLSLLSIFLVPVLFLLGYSVRLGRAAALGRDRPPAFEDWWGLMVDGFRLVVAFFLFFVPVGIVWGVLVVAGLESVSALWYFAASLIASAVYPIFYGTGSVRETFRDLRFLRFAATADYWIGYAYMLGIQFVLVLGFVALLLGLLLTLVGILLWVPLFLLITPAALYVQASLWGRIYHDAVEEGVVDPPDRTDDLSTTW